MACLFTENKRYEKILVIASHPDDEVLGCGGTISRFIQEKKEVHVLLLTGGILSRYPHQAQDNSLQHQINELQKNTIEANCILGVTQNNLHFLSLTDQALDVLPLHEVINLIKQQLEEIKPDCVFTHHPGDYNKDHRVCFEATLYATRLSPEEHTISNLFTFEILSSTERAFGAFGSFVPNFYFDITPYINKKKEAIEAYHTEYRSYPHPRSVEGVEALARLRGVEVGLPYAEAFHLVRSVNRCQ